MKKFTSLVLAFLSIFTISFSTGKSSTAYANSNQVIEHLFTHSLIAYEEIAFADGNALTPHLKADCVTSDMFLSALTLLYESGYMLVSPLDVYEFKDGKTVLKELNLPNGKKPLIFSFDDINFYRTKQGMGFVDKIVLIDGKIGSFTENPPKGEEQFSFDKECISILDKFVENHPDFSYNNAKGVIFLTGFDGILGYRTNSDSENRKSEIEEVLPIISKLKQTGWVFGCHSYGHAHMKKQRYSEFCASTKKWLDEVAPLVGDTPLYCYPYGEWVTKNDDGSVCPKHQFLLDNGFNFFFGVGTNSYLSNFNNYLFMDRAPFDGQTITKNPQKLHRFFGNHPFKF